MGKKAVYRATFQAERGNMKVNLLGVSIDAVERWEAMRIITRRIAGDEQTAVFTPNPIMVQRAMKDKRFYEALNRCDLTVADGIGLVYAARIMKLPPLPRVAGIALGEDVLAYAEGAGLRVFLLGGKAGVAERATERLRERFPTIAICGTHHGYFEDEESRALCERIKEARADIVFVCLGSPRQELWIDQNRENLATVKLFMGLGGSLDVWSGNLRRAPRAVSKAGMEWAWRMAHEPRRLQGLVPISSFFCATLRERGKKRKTKRI